MNTKKESFVVYKTWFPALKKKSDAWLGKLFRAIMEYQTTGKVEVKLEDDISLVFDMIKAQFDSDSKKYHDRCNKNKDAAQQRWDKK